MKDGSTCKKTTYRKEKLRKRKSAIITALWSLRDVLEVIPEDLMAHQKGIGYV